jgi:transcriptional regulator with XRE-family HTH domain
VAALSDRIKALRTEKNITQEELGKIVGVVKSTMSMYESGKSIPSDEIKKVLADYFDVTMDYLMGISDERKPAGEQKLSEKELRDIGKQVEHLIGNMDTLEGLEFFNEPQDDEDAEFIRRGLQRFLEDVRIYNKVKYSPKKNKK